VEFNLAQVHEAVEAVVPDRHCVIVRDRRLTYRDMGERSRRVAHALRARGLGSVRPREQLAAHQSGQDHLALFLHNGHEYLEAMLGAFKARVVPCNVNYRYVAEELEYVLRDSSARGLVFHSALAPVVAEVRDRLGPLEVLWQVGDGSGGTLVEGAEWYEDALAAASPTLAPELVASWSPDDLYVLYTGGTTGRPKGVLWRQADIFVAALGGRRLDTDEEWRGLDQLRAHAPSGGARLMPTPPFMHGAAHWMAFNGFANANTIVLSSVSDRFDPVDVVEVVEAEQVEVLMIVGDAFGRPLVEELERRGGAPSSLLVLISGGAPLSPGTKQRLLEVAPSTVLLDGLGASETGQQASRLSSAGAAATAGTFEPGPGACVLSEQLDRLLGPDDAELGWLAQTGRVPLGYLGDPERTARTFPVIGGERYAVPGDRARWRPDGSLELVGRDSTTINSGGEKIFAEEVEQALLRHEAVADCVVVGRRSERWGEEVVAVVQLRSGALAGDDDLVREAGRHLARYKLPKAIVRVPEVRRAASGKADYRWAARVAAGDGVDV
jgi:fatty-acyl-CoA synthase